MQTNAVVVRDGKELCPMALPQMQGLTSNDIQKLFQFYAALSQGFGDFINTTLKCINDIFGYSISTYAIFDDDMNGVRYIRGNYSNYFSRRDLDFYETEGFKSDTSFLNSRIDYANNASKYIFCIEFKDPSVAFERAMMEKGIKYQIRLGSHSRASAPIHVLSVYKPSRSEPLGEYEALLLSAIGKVFSECVGAYKSYERSQKNLNMYNNFLDEVSAGIAFFDPCGNALNYNRMFPTFAARIAPDKTLSMLVADLLALHQEAVKSESVQASRATTLQLNDCHVSVELQQLGRQYDYLPYYRITISEASCEKPAKAPVQKWQSAYHLTVREIEVVQLIQDGLNNTEISEHLYISMSTVKTHIKNIFSKFGVTSRAGLLELLQE